MIVSPNEFLATLKGVAKALADEQSTSLLAEVTPSPAQIALAQQLKSAEKSLIILGALAHNHPQAALIRQWTQFIAQHSGAQWVYLTEGANSAGGWLAGAVPHRLPCGVNVAEPGLSAAEMFKADLHAYLLLNIEPNLDCANPQRVSKALQQADFVVALSPFKAKSLLEQANVILPIATTAEIEGSFVNTAGCWQHFAAAIPTIGESRAAWKLLQTLGNLFELADFNHSCHAFIREELEPALNQYRAKANQSLDFIADTKWLGSDTNAIPQSTHPVAKKLMTRISEWPIYRIDSLVRRSLALQTSATDDKVAAFMNAALARELKLSADQLVRLRQGEGQALLTLLID